MHVFVAGATGVVGRRLVPLLLQAGHQVSGTTRSVARARDLERQGASPVVLDVFDAAATEEAVRAAAPDVLISQLTDLPHEFDGARIAAALAGNARLRIEGTRHLVRAARRAGVGRLIVQSIAFAYAPGREPHLETDPLDLDNPTSAVTVNGVLEMERQALEAEQMVALVLRYGLFYGPGTWAPAPARRPALHVDAAAHAALLATTRGTSGVYNVADDDGAVSIARARAELGFDPGFRLP